MFAARREVLDALLADPEWSGRLDKAESNNDLVQVLVGFCKEKGYKVKTV